MQNSAPKQFSAKKMGIAHIARVFNLILCESHHQHFNPLYLQPRYMAGLGIQLFTLLFGFIRRHDGHWCRAKAVICEVDREFAGFFILRRNTREDEIFMFAITPEQRRQGYGRKMLEKILTDASAHRPLIADCLPASRSMKTLLRRLGFRRDPPHPAPLVQRYSYTPESKKKTPFSIKSFRWPFC